MYPVAAAALTSDDSINCTVTGGAAVSYVHGSGGKGSEDGLLLCTWNHSISDCLHTEVGIRGSSNSSRPFIEKAALIRTGTHSDFETGFLNARYGFKSLYRPHTIHNFLFDNPLLWNTYGFGVSYRQKVSSSVQVLAQTTINSKESTQIHALVQGEWAHQSAAFISGIQTYSPENQDNIMSIGSEWSGTWSKLQVHCIGSYNNYSGFGHNRNASMVPGYKGIGFVECTYMPVPTLTFSGMGYYEQMHKSYNHEFTFCGTDVCWTAVTDIGIGCGMEWQQDDATVTLMPRSFIRWTPVKDAADIQLGVQPTSINNAIPNWRITGELWIRL